MSEETMTDSSLSNLKSESEVKKSVQIEGKMPWEKRENEGTKAFNAFLIYLNMGYKRSLKAVANRLGKSTRLIERWSSLHDWTIRIDSYDEYKLKQKLALEKEIQIKNVAELQEQRDELGKISFNTSISILKMCLETIQYIDKQNENKKDDEKVRFINPENLPNYLKTASALAQIALENRTEALAIDRIVYNLKLDTIQVDGENNL